MVRLPGQGGQVQWALALPGEAQAHQVGGGGDGQGGAKVMDVHRFDAVLPLAGGAGPGGDGLPVHGDQQRALFPQLVKAPGPPDSRG